MYPIVQAMQMAAAVARTLGLQAKPQVNALKPAVPLFKKSRMEQAMRCATTSQIKALKLTAVRAIALTMQTADVMRTAFVWIVTTIEQPQKAKLSVQHF